jgi:methionyl-tRNA formyltransferase
MSTLDDIESGNINPVQQSSGDESYASKITKDLSPIDWNKSAEEIHNQVRGLQSWPCAYTFYNGKQLKIHKTVKSSKVANSQKTVIDNKNCLTVCCGDGKCLDILELQLEGKKRMDVKSFLQGNNIEIGQILGD